LAIVKEKVEKQAAVVIEEPDAGEGVIENCQAQEEQEGKAVKKKAKKRKATAAELKKYAERLIELEVLQRKVVKQTIMTICYGVTTLGARRQVLGQLEDMVGDKVELTELNDLAGYLSTLVLKSIDEVFKQAMQIKKWFDSVSKVFNSKEVPTGWIAPSGLTCVQPYKKTRKVQSMTRRQKVTLADTDGDKVDKGKQRMGFPPNFVHSLDATHMMLVAQACKGEGMTFAGVHDSFWTHACDAPRLNVLIRDAFVDLHQRPILNELYRDLQIQLGGTDLPPLPTQGDLDVTLVRGSAFFFH